MKYFFYILIMNITFVGFGQINHRSAIATTGATAEIDGNVFSYSIGQTIFTTESSSDLTVTQGVLQPYIVLCAEHTLEKVGDAICGASPVSLSITTNQNYQKYQWYLIENGDTLTVNGANSSSYTPNHPGEYYVVYVGDFCVNLTDTISVSLDANSSIPIIAKTNSVLSTSDNVSDSYQWYVEIRNKEGDIKKHAIFGQNKATYTPIFDGNYFVEVIYGVGGCKIMSNGRTINFLGRSITSENTQYTNNTVYLSLAGETVLNAYPYPSFESFTLDMYSDYTGEVFVKLIDMNGKQVSTQEFSKNSSLLSEQVDTTELSEGLYSVIVSTEVGVEVTKMLIIE